MAGTGAPGAGEPPADPGSDPGKLALWVTAIAGAISAVAAVMVILVGDGGLFSPGGPSTEPTPGHPSAATTEASPPEAAEGVPPEPPGDPFTEAERRLARRVVHPGREGAIECSPARGAEAIDNAVATLSCFPPLRYPVEVTVASFQNESVLDVFIENAATEIEWTTDSEALDSNDNYRCPYYGPWGIIGPYLCRSDGSEYRAIWGFTNDAYNETHDGEVFAVLASTPDQIALNDWWTTVPV